jgi:hypothetical protein
MLLSAIRTCHLAVLGVGDVKDRSFLVAAPERAVAATADIRGFVIKIYRVL